MLQRKIGNDSIGAIGYGAMVLDGRYGHSNDETASIILNKALDIGANMIDTADAYEKGYNETLIAKSIGKRRSEAFIASKFGIVYEDKYNGTILSTGFGIDLKINASKEYATYALEQSLKRLETDYLDLWYLHYPEQNRDIEETIHAMAKQVSNGKVKYLGLSNVTADEIRRAHKVHPITAVQYEYSLWRREIENHILPTCKELGITVVPWAPLGSGFLTGTVKSLDKNDFRKNNPKFNQDNLQKNIDRFAPLQEIANNLGITSAQLALSWLLAQGENIIPIPGTRNPQRIVENSDAASIILSKDILEQINKIASQGSAVGATII
jgi:aryl-alcohol dehydrogenase-like predicted oxidoreductase